MTHAFLSDLFEPAFELELEQVERAVAYYEQSMDVLLASEVGGSIARYYSVGPSTPPSLKRFKALFFATRLQPVLAYVQGLARDHGRPARVLDVGCGYGLETTLIAASGASVMGVDRSDAKLGGARTVADSLRRVAGTSCEIEYKRQGIEEIATGAGYDVVYSSATLHHIEPVAPACRAIAGLLAPSGVFFLSDENGASPAQQLVVQRKIGWTSPRVRTDVDPATGQRSPYGNENIRPLWIWRRHMQRAGLRLLAARYCRFLPPLPLDTRWLLAAERQLRRLPLLRELVAIGFVAAFGRAEAS